MEYDSTNEVTWYITVTKLEDWTTSKFEHEYHTIHAGMTKKSSELDPSLRPYTQLAHLRIHNKEEKDESDWTCITRLTFVNTADMYTGFQHPGYRETAGKHIFCRLDQKGLIARLVLSLDGKNGKGDIGGSGGGGYKKVLIVVLHRRSSATDEVSQSWIEKRTEDAKGIIASDDGDNKLLTYRLFVDVTPKDVDRFFKDTQFAGGEWNRYLAVEEFTFSAREDAERFLKERNAFFGETGGVGTPVIVVGDALRVV